MKQNGILSNIPLAAKEKDLTPIRSDAFDLKDSQKIEAISLQFRKIMEILGLDLENESLKDTPDRVAKMYIEEIFSGINPKNKPNIKLFKNDYQYDRLLIQNDIRFYSVCEHHFVPIEGRIHIAYIPQDYVIGLSKLNRIVQFFAKRPQVQERLTVQIGEELKKILKTKDVGVFVQAKHFCVCMRGIQDDFSHTITSFLSGQLGHDNLKKEFFQSIKM